MLSCKVQMVSFVALNKMFTLDGVFIPCRCRLMAVRLWSAPVKTKYCPVSWLMDLIRWLSSGENVLGLPLDFFCSITPQGLLRNLKWFNLSSDDTLRAALLMQLNNLPTFIERRLYSCHQEVRRLDRRRHMESKFLTWKQILTFKRLWSYTFDQLTIRSIFEFKHCFQQIAWSTVFVTCSHFFFFAFWGLPLNLLIIQQCKM